MESAENSPFACSIWNQEIYPLYDDFNLPPTGLHCPLYPWVLWFLWSARNKLVFEDIVLNEQEIVSRATCEARKWQEAQELKKKPPRRTTPARHLATPISLERGVSCFVDAAWQASSQQGGFGWIFKDSTARVISSNSSNRSPVASALMAEALAVKAALLDAVSLGFKSLSVHSDSKVLMELDSLAKSAVGG
ncbi:hypothetical protein YC2023_113524 [Brassica napus]